MQSFMIALMRRQKVAIAFGRVLREARKQKGLSQEDLAGDAEFDRTIHRCWSEAYAPRPSPSCFNLPTCWK